MESSKSEGTLDKRIGRDYLVFIRDKLKEGFGFGSSQRSEPGRTSDGEGHGSPFKAISHRWGLTDFTASHYLAFTPWSHLESPRRYLKIPAESCRESPKCKEVYYCNSPAPLNPSGCAKRYLTGRANPAASYGGYARCAFSIPNRRHTGKSLRPRRWHQ